MEMERFVVSLPKYKDTMTRKQHASYCKALDRAAGDLTYLQYLVTIKIHSRGREAYPSSQPIPDALLKRGLGSIELMRLSKRQSFRSTP